MKASGGTANFPCMRLFVAIDLDEAARALAVSLQKALAEHGIPARFELAEKLHLTLAFLGKTPPEKYDPVLQALRTAAGTIAPFTVVLDCLGAFPNSRRPRLYWLGASRPQPHYTECAAAVRANFAALGWQFREEAVPHVTLCRLKRPVGLPELRLPQTVDMEVRELTLYESVPAGPTTRYVVRECVPLGNQ